MLKCSGQTGKEARGSLQSLSLRSPLPLERTVPCHGWWLQEPDHRWADGSPHTLPCGRSFPPGSAWPPPPFSPPPDRPLPSLTRPGPLSPGLL